MTIGSHELALTIINDGEGYQHRKAIGESVTKRFTALNVHAAARDWVAITLAGARHYEKQFGDGPGTSCFTVGNILEAAVELAEYYERHAQENAALETVAR